MKKILGLLLVFGSFIFLISCKNDTIDLKELLNEIEITFKEGNNALNVTSDITLPLVIEGIDIQWQSNSDNLIISNEIGKVKRANEDINVSLTAFISFKKEKEFRNLMFIIKLVFIVMIYIKI